MKYLLILTSLIASLGAFASISINDLRPGDIVLLPLDCRVCDAISSEENSPYSHSGLVARNDQGELVILEALGKVRSYNLKLFLKRSPTDRPPHAFRSKELKKLFYRHPALFDQFESELFTIFETNYKDAPFDHHYLWGDNEYYCSEFIAKLINRFLKRPIRPYPMSFKKNWKFWVRYFDGKVPQGKLGISPASFERSNKFYELGAVIF